MLRRPLLSYLLLLVAGTLRAEANIGAPIRQTDPRRLTPTPRYPSVLYQDAATKRRGRVASSPLLPSSVRRSALAGPSHPAAWQRRLLGSLRHRTSSYRNAYR